MRLIVVFRFCVQWINQKNSTFKFSVIHYFMRCIGIILISNIIVLYFLDAQSYCENKYDYVWMIGYADQDTIEDEYGGSEINFNSLPPLFERHSRLTSAPWQNCSMSDINGNLIFYSNGCSIYNALDMEMTNGDSLNPGEIYDARCPDDGYVGDQNMISLPDLQNDSVYYIIYIDKVFNHEPGAPFIVHSRHAYSSTIKISEEYPSGRVFDKNHLLLDDTAMLGSPLSAVKTANGLGWWVITPDRWTNGFHIFLLENGQMVYSGIQYIGVPTVPEATGGQGKFSPDGRYFAWYHPKNGLFLYDFDRATGSLDNFRHIDIDDEIYIVGGCEFSPSSRFLYVNHLTKLYQLDMMAEDIQGSLTHIADYDGFGDPLPTSFFYMERTPDNRIFMNVANGSQYFHVIQEPNKKGAECRFEQHAIKLPTINNFTLPHFPNYRLGAVEDSLCDDFVVATEPVPQLSSGRYMISPNPATDVINVITSDGQLPADLHVEIRSLQGEPIANSREHTIELKDHPPGIYICLISEKDHTQVIKFVKVE